MGKQLCVKGNCANAQKILCLFEDRFSGDSGASQAPESLASAADSYVCETGSTSAKYALEGLLEGLKGQEEPDLADLYRPRMVCACPTCARHWRRLVHVGAK